MSEASEILLEMLEKKVSRLTFSISVQAVVIILLAFFICQLETKVNSTCDRVDTLTLCNGKIIQKEIKCTK